MGREKQEGLSEAHREMLLEVLEGLGKQKWLKRWKEHMAIPPSISPSTRSVEGHEKTLRYLLFRVLINQQAKVEKVRELCVALYEKFGDSLLFEPYKVPEQGLYEVFKVVAGKKGSSLYKVGALGGIKPISLFAYRLKAYEGFARWLASSSRGLFSVIKDKLSTGKAIGLFEFLNAHPVLEAGWVGNDPKACRMFVNWVIFLMCEVWKDLEFPLTHTMMIVDGHVGKVFCRAGLLDEVLFESNRPFIIQASKMRQQIEELVTASKRIPFYVDNGAFYLFEDGFCTDLAPDCARCEISDLCKKRRKWTAYSSAKRSTTRRS
jgi:endonuclease III